MAQFLAAANTGFRRIILRGDTDFSQTAHLDRRDAAGDIKFLFGVDARPVLKALAEDLPADAYSYLERPPRYTIKTAPRQEFPRVKSQIVARRGFETIRLIEKNVAEFEYRPTACKKSYRVVVLRKNLEIGDGQTRLFKECRYFFYITNDREMSAEDVVFASNDRCNQENLIAELKSGVHALATPVDNLISNWAYMVMASLAWSLKAWSTMLTPVEPRHAAQHLVEKSKLLRMEFATFLFAAFILMPCQIVRGGRWLIYRLLSWNSWQDAFFRLVERRMAAAYVNMGLERHEVGVRMPRSVWAF